MNSRSRYILLEIIKRNSISVSEMAKRFHVSTRTIRNDINEINYFFLENHYPPLKTIDSHEITLDQSVNRPQLIFRLINIKDVLITSYTRDERLLEILYLLSKDNEIYKIDDLAEQLFVSKSTISKDINHLRTKLIGNVKIIGNSNGIQLEGHEIFIRISLLQLYFRNMNQNIVVSLLKKIHKEEDSELHEVYWHLFENLSIEYIQDILNRIKILCSTNLSDFENLYLIAAISLMIHRSHLMEEQKELSLFHYETKVNQSIVEDLFLYIKNKDIFIYNEEKQYLFYLCCILCKSCFIIEHQEEFYELDFIIDQFKKSMKQLGMCDNKNIYYDLSYEIKNIYVEKQIYWECHQGIVQSHDEYLSRIFDQVKKSWLQANYNFLLNEDDYWRLASHYFLKNTKRDRLKILVVSDKPRSMIEMLMHQLMMFFEIDIVAVCSVQNIQYYLSIYDVDYVLSSIHVQNVDHVLYVHPILSDEEILLLKQYFPTHLKQIAESDNDWLVLESTGNTELIERINLLLLKNNVISHDINPILKKVIYDTHGLKIRNNMYLSICEHEIVYRNCTIRLNQTTEILFSKSNQDYIQYIHHHNP